jgi:uncharacterized protein (TIGR00255 family)
MLRSMTAFSNSEIDTQGWFVSWEVRSVNHRYLDVSVRLPERFRCLDGDVRSRVASALRRGKVDCILICNRKTQARRLQINHDLLQELLATSREIERSLAKPSQLNVLELIRWPGVLAEEPAEKDDLPPQVLLLLNDALEKLIAARELEGRHIAGLLEERCRRMHEQLVQVRRLLPEVLQAIRQKIVARIAEVSALPDHDRLEQELVYLTQRLDISEEVERLEAHVAEVQRLLTVAEPVGRRLDFLMQEMNREATTIGSKAADIELTRASVEMKVLIEQMREQIQNVE